MSHQHTDMITKLAYYDDLNQDERTQIDQHLRACFNCRKQLAIYQTMDRELAHPIDSLDVQLDLQLGVETPTKEPKPLRSPHLTARHRPAWLDDWLHRLTHPQIAPMPVMGAVVAIAFLIIVAAVGSKPFGMVEQFLQTIQNTDVVEVAPTPTADEAMNNEQDSPTIDASGMVTITFGCRGNHCTDYEPVATLFHEQHPNIHVEFVPIDEYLDIPSDYPFVEEAFRAALEKSARTVAATVDTAHYWFYEWGNADKYFADLTPFIQLDANISQDAFYPGALKEFQWNGGTWALPSDITPQLMAYNKKAFDEAGLPYPNIDWTQEEFLAIAQKLTKRSGDKVDRYGFIDYMGGGETIFVHALLIEMLATISDDGAELPENIEEAFTNRLTDAVRWYTDLAIQHGVMLHLSPNKSRLSYDQMSRAAMWTEQRLVQEPVGSSSELKKMRPKLDIGFAPIPGKTATALLDWGPGYSLSRQSKHPQESWLWMEFLTRHNALVFQDPPVSLSSISGVPARRSTADDYGYWDRWDEADRRTIEYSIENALQNVFPTRSWSGGENFALLRAVAKAVDKVFAGKSLDEALAATNQELEKVLDTIAEQNSEMEVAASGPVTITFGCQSYACDSIQSTADLFHQQHPTIHVEMVPIDDLYVDASGSQYEQEKGVEAIAAMVDTVYSWFSPNTNVDKYVMDLAPFIHADKNISPGDFYPGALEQLRWEGGTWALPADVAVQLIAYNKTLFDQADLPYPTIDWTREDFLDLAQQLTTRSGDRVERHGFVDFRGGGKTIFVQDPIVEMLTAVAAGESISGTHTEENVLHNLTDIVEWYTDLALRHEVMLYQQAGEIGRPPLVSERVAVLDSYHSAIRAGKIAMWTDFSYAPSFAWSGSSGMSGLQLDIGYAPIPGKTAKGLLGWGPGYFISRQAEHPQESWLWIEFLSRHYAIHEADSLENDQLSDRIPARRSVAEASGYWERWSEDDRVAIQHALENAVENVALEEAWYNYADVAQNLQIAVDEILAGEPFDEALVDTQTTIREQIGKLTKDEVENREADSTTTSDPRSITNTVSSE